jgi:hypothetical protein
MATRVLGGMHSGASFAPTNGVFARLHVLTQLAELREQGVKNPRGRRIDDHQRRHHAKRS